MSLSNENLKLWDAVATTDPTHTKAVKMGSRAFTAIDAYYQIHRATQEWGPVGQGWGWSPTFVYDVPGLVICELGLWYKRDEQTCTVMAVGSARSGKDKPDHEAPKKALTDAITKALSYLGFNADVFLGIFDDSKYKLDLWLTRLDAELHECENRAAFLSLKDRWRLLVTGWPQDDKGKVGTRINEFEDNFPTPEEASA